LFLHSVHLFIHSFIHKIHFSQHPDLQAAMQHNSQVTLSITEFPGNITTGGRIPGLGANSFIVSPRWNQEPGSDRAIRSLHFSICACHPCSICSLTLARPSASCRRLFKTRPICQPSVSTRPQADRRADDLEIWINFIVQALPRGASRCPTKI